MWKYTVKAGTSPANRRKKDRSAGVEQQKRPPQYRLEKDRK